MIQENERNVNLRSTRYNRLMRLFILGCSLLIVLFFLSARSTLDPDFGWHLRMGEIILKSGIPQSDPFTYSMSSYPFVDHEWFTDSFIAKIYPVIGVEWLAIVFVFVALFAVGIQWFGMKKQWSAVPLLLGGLCLVPYLGIRPQVLSWLFGSLLFVLIFNKTYWLRFRWGVPLLFLLWANMHGAFALGSIVLFITLFSQSIAARKVFFIDLFIFIFCISSTFLTPYHFAIWREVWLSLSDASLRWSIQEWLPALATFNVGFVFLFPLSVSLLIRYRSRFSPTELALFGTLFFFALSSSRNIPFFALCAIPITAKGIGLLYDEIKKITVSRKRFVVSYRVLLSVVVGIILLQCFFVLPTIFRSSTTLYPANAVTFLKEHPSAGNVFAEYNWGGYLIWQYPEKKVFIDGRMPSWKQASTKEESRNAFSEYQQFFTDMTTIPAFLNTYHIDTVLLAAPQNQSGLVRLVNALGYRPVAVSKALSDTGFHRVYSDDQAVVYRKK